ncbi:LysR family transcriptional regulator [Gordonia rubripertincta]|uniref:LysR substrate-binding domain-containing protein n=1 Tax=Gordonia rubripertincta TaxID=36822 RepID=A0ABT4MXC6_GORRU|nr:LysR substrate-binding domain-containing protein [Gordonia rubripertincta]MCZ4551469.1 LysR substrate-binding domain-containing protein [Gordonia rubripertincta]
MNIGELRAFSAVAEELHFGRAAERLHVAQPALSRTIGQLERKLGSRLFERNTRSVKLTSSGRALVEPARDVFTALRRAEAAVLAAEDGEAGLVRIAFAGVSTNRLIAQLARTVRLRAPGIELELSSQNFARPAMRRLVNGDTDIALGRWDIIPSTIMTRVVMPDSLVIAVADTHPLARSEKISIAQLSGESFITLPAHEGAVLPDRMRRLAQASGFVAEVVQVAPDTHTALALVGAQVGCHLTLASVARNVMDPNVAFVPVTDPAPSVDMRAAWRRDDTNPALHAVLAKCLEYES